MQSRALPARAARVLLAGAVVSFLMAPIANASAPVKITASDGAANDSFGLAVAISGDTAIVGSRNDDDNGADSGAAYIYRWNGVGWTEEAKLLASDGATGDEFGTSVSIDGDTAIVGAHFDDDIASDSGAAYVFTRTGTTWTQQDKLTAADGVSLAWFGESVSIESDTAIVGSIGDDDSGIFSGSAYVFTRSGGVWSLQDKIIASDGAQDDRFGWSVSLSGDTAIVGAYSDDEAGPFSSSGAAFVFTRTGSTWSQQAKLIPADGQADDRFGYSVSLSGDSAIIGAHFDDDLGNITGSAYVYTRSGTLWTQQTKLNAPDAAPNDAFGGSVSIDGDTAVVGTFGGDNNGNNDGTAYVFTRSGTVWSARQKLTVSDSADSDQFGIAVALSSEIAIVGAWRGDGAVADSGSAYIFERVGPVWIGPDRTVSLVNLPAQASSSNLGTAVSVSGDNAIIGANRNDVPGGFTIGSAHVYSRTGTTWTELEEVFPLDNQIGTAFEYNFGISVSIDGDTAIVGAHTGDGFGAVANGGAVYVYREAGGWMDGNVEKLIPSAGVAASDEYGWAVSLSGDTAIAGAPGDNGPAGADQGSAYVFEGSAGFFSEEAKLTASDAAAGDEFGYSAAIDGDTAIVGARNGDGVVADSGAAYVFTRTGSTWTEQAKLTASDGVAFDFFGFSVAIDGDTAFVGAYADNGFAGSTYVFTRTGTVWTQQQKLTGAGSLFFGYSVSIDDDTAIIGALVGSGNQGAAHIFTRVGTLWTEQNTITGTGGGFGDAVAIHGDTALIGAPSAAPNGKGHFFVGTFGSSSSTTVRNITENSTSPTLSSAVGNAATGDVLGATYGSFSSGDPIDLAGQNIAVTSSAEIRQPHTAIWTIDGGGSMRAQEGRALSMFGATNLSLGSLVAPTIHNARTLDSYFGTLLGNVTNEFTGEFVIDSNTQIGGDLVNNGLVTLDGVLAVTGVLTNNGVIDDVSAARSIGGSGVLADGDLMLGTDATLELDSLGSAIVAGGDFESAINSNTRFDLATAELRMDGDSPQSLELMSTDIGNDADGLDRTMAGHYPLGTLRIGPTATTVNLFDAHDNDNLGQSAKEVIYTSNLIIDAGATLNTNGCTIYYETLTNNGNVDDPNNLVQIAQCVADLTSDGVVDGADLATLLAQWGTPGSADLTGDGNVDGADLAALLAAWGTCP